MGSRVFSLVLFVIAAAVGVIVGAWALPLTGYAKTTTDHDSAVAGVCMYSNDSVLTQSKLGQNATKRLQALTHEVQAQIQKDSEPLAKRVQAFQKKADDLSDKDRQKQQKQLQQSQQALQQEVRILKARLNYTNQAVTQSINKKIEPLVEEAYAAHDCGVLFNRGAILKGNQGNDLTPDVIGALDKQSSTINFNLLELPKQTQQKQSSQKQKPTSEQKDTQADAD